MLMSPIPHRLGETATDGEREGEKRERDGSGKGEGDKAGRDGEGRREKTA